MDSINVKDLKLKETSKNNISIDSSNVFYESHERNKKEQER